MWTYSLPCPYLAQSASSFTTFSLSPNGFNWENAHHNGRPMKRDVSDAGTWRGVADVMKCVRACNVGGVVVASVSWVAYMSGAYNDTQVGLTTTPPNPLGLDPFSSSNLPRTPLSTLSTNLSPPSPFSQPVLSVSSSTPAHHCELAA